MFFACDSQYGIFGFDAHHTYRQAPVARNYLLRVFLVFLKLVCRLIYGGDFFRRAEFRVLPPFPSLSYPEYYRLGFRERDDLGLRMKDYRIGAKHTNHCQNPQKKSRRKFYGLGELFQANQIDRTHLGFYRRSKSNNLSHRLSYLLFPKTVQYLLVYTLVAYRNILSLCQTPNVRSVAGNFFYYSTL